MHTQPRRQARPQQPARSGPSLEGRSPPTTWRWAFCSVNCFPESVRAETKLVESYGAPKQSQISLVWSLVYVILPCLYLWSNLLQNLHIVPLPPTGGLFSISYQTRIFYQWILITNALQLTRFKRREFWNMGLSGFIWICSMNDVPWKTQFVPWMM